MKKSILFGILISLILISGAGCEKNDITGNVVKETITKYVCSDGSTVDNQEDCPKIEEKVVEKIVEKIKCEDGTLVNKGENCPKIVQPNVAKEIPSITLEELKTIVKNIVNSNYKLEAVNSVFRSGDEIEIELEYYSIDKEGITKISYEFIKELAKALDGYKDSSVRLTLQGSGIWSDGSLTTQTTKDNMNKVRNLDMGYEDWKRQAKLSYHGDLY